MRHTSSCVCFVSDSPVPCVALVNFGAPAEVTVAICCHGRWCGAERQYPPWLLVDEVVLVARNSARSRSGRAQ
jgi:hypothetical protein